MLKGMVLVRPASSHIFQPAFSPDATLETLQAAKANALLTDLGLVQEAIKLGVTAQRAKAQDKHWERWDAFCVEHNIDPFLKTYKDPIPILQIFAQRYRDGRLAPSKVQVKSRTVEDALRAVGQKFARMGAPDIRKDATGSIDFRIQRQLRHYAKLDPPPARVKPVPITIIIYILQQAYGPVRHDDRCAIANIIVIAFFYLLCLGEYTGTTTDDAAFSLADIGLHVGDRRLNLFTAPAHDIFASTAASYTFTTQKNGTRNETITHGRSGDPYCCPVMATIRLVLYHLGRKTVTPKTPIASYYTTNNRRAPIKSQDITDTLRNAAAFLRSDTGLNPQDISARSLRAGGAMALLCGNVDHNLIQMLGRWHSDAMMRYLHLQAQPIMKKFAVAMFNDGNYTFLPDDTVPVAADLEDKPTTR
jgi:hypothetical protein